MKSLKRNNLGKNLLVEQCQKITLKPLLREYKKRLKGLFLNSNVQVNNEKIELTTSQTGNGGSRYWFICGLCKKRVGTLFEHPIGKRIGCRKCLSLEYRKRRYKGMIESQI